MSGRQSGSVCLVPVQMMMTITDDGSQNERLQHVVTQLLDETGHHELRQIRVDVEDRRVVLSGSVPTYYLKQIAQETARQACPDRKVDNDLQVATS